MTSMSQEAAALSRGAEQVRAARGDVTRLCTQLSSQIQATAPQWQGGGGRAFQNLMVMWTQRQQRIVGALDTLSASLDRTEQDTLVTDQAQAAMASRLSARLG